MIILGLGSNLGDRLAQLRHAFDLIKKIPTLEVTRVSPLYISDPLLPENAPASWDNNPYLNLAIRCETAMEPLELLARLKAIEVTAGRRPEKTWGPRIIDIDILAWDDRIMNEDRLHIPHKSLPERPFALWPLADIAPQWIYPLADPAFQGKTAAEIAARWGSRFSGEAPLHTRQISQRIDSSQLIGILNLTPDSFSDGGQYLQPEKALQQAYHLVHSGAEIIDVGAEATGPNASPLNANEEWQRLEPILTTLMTEKTKMLIPPKISVDTRHTNTAKKALAFGVDWLNDISGLSDPPLCEIAAEHSCDIVIMHHLSIPADLSVVLPSTANPVTLLLDWAEKNLTRLDRYGIARDRLIFDVGIGFGKTAEQSLLLLQNISAFKSLGLRLLVGHSRKSFLKLFVDKPPQEKDIETLALSLYLSRQKIDYLRIHNVEMVARGTKIMRFFVD